MMDEWGWSAPSRFPLTPPPLRFRQGVVGISEIIVRPGLINVDFADVRSVMSNAGTALMGIGRGEGKTRAEDAAAAAISSPLLEAPIDKAKGIVFNIVGGSDMTLQEINAAAEVIYENVDPSANIIFGALVDERMAGEMSITVLATGFQTEEDAERSGMSAQQQRSPYAAAQAPQYQQYGSQSRADVPPYQGGQSQQSVPPQPQQPAYPQPGYYNQPPAGPPQPPMQQEPPPPRVGNDFPDFLSRLKRSQRRGS
jgi:cell division protein FtsZ